MKKAGVLNLTGLLLSLPADLLWIWVLGGTLLMGMSRLSSVQEGMTVQFDFQPRMLPWLLLMLAALLLWLLGLIFSLRNTVRAFRCRPQKRADWMWPPVFLLAAHLLTRLLPSPSYIVSIYLLTRWVGIPAWLLGWLLRLLPFAAPLFMGLSALLISLSAGRQIAPQAAAWKNVPRQP